MASNVFTGLKPNTEYAFCQRIAETATDYASAQSGYTTVVTLKNPTAAPAAPTVQTATDTAVTLTAISGYEYSKDGATWQTSSVFSGLTTLETYTFYQRVAETEMDYASPASPALTIKVKHVAAKPSSPTLKEKTNNRIEIEGTAGYEYSIDGSNWVTDPVFTDLKPNTVYSIYCRVSETDTHYSSEVSEALTVTTLKNTAGKPIAPVLSSKTDSSVTLTINAGYEYSIDGTTWQEAALFNGLSPNTEYTFYQRIAETDTFYASEKSNGLKVLTLKKTVSAPSAPTLQTKTVTSVTLTPVNGYEYSMDGTTWQDDNTFNGLKVNTEYTFYQRIKETETSYVSATSTALSVTTPKHTVFAPIPPVVLRSTATSITLAPYTGFEYSKDGVNWQKSNLFTGLAANTTYNFYQRIAETDDTFASAASTVCNAKTTSKATCSITPAAPIIASYGTEQVVLVAMDGYEYSRNGTTWQSSTTFSGLSANTSYTFYQRIKETAGEKASNSKSVKQTTAKAGVTSNTYYDKLVAHINSYGSTDSDGYKTIIQAVTNGNFTYYFAMQNKGGGVYFDMLVANSGSTYIGSDTEFILYKNSKSISVDFNLLYYYNGRCVDAVTGTKALDRSTYTPNTTYGFYQSGTYITSTMYSDNFNLTMETLCNKWDTYLYSKCGFGLEELGFVNYPGKGSAVCDPLSSYHSGSSVTRNARPATCVIDGYTGDSYCSACGEKKVTGSTIACSGHHTYSNSCDKSCNTCGEERRIEHTFSNVCDHTCDLCNATRGVIDHTYDNNCDTHCNACQSERKVPHTYDDRADLICNDCGYERPPYTPGDLDDNDEITDRDAVHLLYHTFLPNLYPVNQDCDFNGDGSVNDKDAVYLLYHTFLPNLYPIN